MNVRMNRNQEDLDLMNKILPKEPLTVKLAEQVLKVSKKYLLVALKTEIEIYKAFPKRGKMDYKEFDTRNHKTCFMGQGFNVKNSQWGDADLVDYRKAVGTISHGSWGNCTLLEAWGGDHYDKYPEMVKGVFSYCKGTRSTLPPIQFHIFPLFKNEKSGRMKFDDEDKLSYEHEWLTELNGHRATQAAYHNLKAPKPYDSVDDPKGTYGKGENASTLRQEFERDWERKKRGF